jgi:hypothetical protein
MRCLLGGEWAGVRIVHTETISQFGKVNERSWPMGGPWRTMPCLTTFALRCAGPAEQTMK